MVAEAQRNVIIALKLAADPKNQAIANQVASQAKTVAVAGLNAAKQAAGVHSRIEAGRTADHGAESSKRIDNALKENDKRAKAATELSDKIRKTEELRTQSRQKANEAGLIAVQGMLSMAEGAAKLGLVTEDNFQKFAKQFVVIQSGMQVFKGATDMYWKGREALVALSAATNAQTTANNLMSASNVRAASTTALSGGSGVVRGGTALAGLGTLALLAGELAAAAVFGVALHDAIKLLMGSMGDGADASDTMTGSLLGWWDASTKAAESTKTLTKAEEKRQKRLKESQKFAEKEAVRSGFQADLRNRRNRIVGHRALLAGETPGDTADRRRQNALGDVRAAESEVERTRKLDTRRGASGQFVSDENRIRVAKALEDAQLRLLDIEQQRLSTVRDQNTQLSEQLKTEQARLKSTVAAGKTEKERLLEKFGNLNPVLQSQFRMIAAKADSGKEISELDKRVLVQAGFKGELTQQFGAKKGKKAGGEDALRSLGFFEKFANANHDQLMKTGSVSAQLGLGKSHEKDIVEQASPIAEALKKQTEARIKLEAEFLKISEASIKGLNQPFIKAQEKVSAMMQKAAADASDAITASSMKNVEAMKSMTNAFLQGQEEMKKAIDQSELLKKAYGT